MTKGAITLIEPIYRSRLSVRTQNCLTRAGYSTLQQVFDDFAEDNGRIAWEAQQRLLRIPNLGRKSINEIEEALIDGLSTTEGRKITSVEYTRALWIVQAYEEQEQNANLETGVETRLDGERGE